MISASTAEARKLFAQWFLSQSEGNGFLDNVWWSDECNFPLSTSSNRQHVRFWTDDISDVPIFEKTLNCLSITVFAAFSMSGMFQPFFFMEIGRPVTVNGERYRSMILTHFVPELKHRRNYSRTIFMQDEAPSHTANVTFGYGTKSKLVCTTTMTILQQSA